MCERTNSAGDLKRSTSPRAVEILVPSFAALGGMQVSGGNELRLGLSANNQSGWGGGGGGQAHRALSTRAQAIRGPFSFRSIFEGKIILWSYMGLETGQILQDIGSSLPATISHNFGGKFLAHELLGGAHHMLGGGSDPPPRGFTAC